ncbi:Rad21/Rec8 N terminus domain containing protein [Euroglyphus maynei]|uniref:Rad21/Rec8 N terminus domain containing protein n=1 Tax=Euroglyphus maynei TaxID=6958 RepID=A0A1Y3AX31_EURMA|nr:Rad21/Rec8 N terminus domain containing protein [Euroglyphus maynei]
MFFVPDILTRKGPLSVVWLAAHYDRKLTKTQIISSNIDDLIDIITSTNIKISLRITCDLMIVNFFSMNLIAVQRQFI